jgi:uncharacterized membrane protein YdjX (TVP38/TMEM64 family)
MKRLLIAFVAAAGLMLAVFALWGESWERSFTVEGSVEWLQRSGSWAWAAGVGLLVSDLVLPVPSTCVMSALGIVYGPWLGGALSAFGTLLGGVIAYWSCRALGERAAQWLLGDRRGDAGRLSTKLGMWVIALTRCLPVLPELTCCMAGLERMPLARFHVALACGCLPTSFVFAWIGAEGLERPGLALFLSIALPALLFAVAMWWMRRVRRV